MSYKTIIDPIENETTVKKSRFIGRLYPVATEEEVKNILSGIKKEHHQANHHCTAFRLNDRQRTERYSDDGEPGGTAGMPMLEVLRGQDLENVLMVSIRYFGGTKLGTGGLVRAYTESAQEVIAEADVVEVGNFRRFSVEVGYDLSGKIEYHLNSSGYLLDSVDYKEKVIYNLYIDAGAVEKEETVFVELTNGQCDITYEDPREGYIMNGTVVLED